MSWVQRLLLSEGIASKEELVGLSSQELKDFEEKTRLVLPARYTDFLRAAGKSAGLLGLDIDLFYPRVLELRSEVEELITECKPDYLLPANAHVFSGYQGSQYHFFCCDGDDPPVFRLFDDDLEPTELTGTFSAFFRYMVSTTPKSR